MDGFLYALDSADGRVLWKFALQSHGDCGPAVGSGAFADVVVQASNEECEAGCSVFAINATTGSQLWRTRVGKAGITGGGTIGGGSYFAGSWNRRAAAYDLRTGALKWEVETNGEIESRPAYDAATDTVFFSAEESKSVIAVDADTGRLRWNYSEFGGVVNGSPSLAAGLVYVGANDGYLRALNATTGALRFKFKACEYVFASAAIADSGMVFIACGTPTDPRAAPGIGAVFAVNPAARLS